MDDTTSVSLNLPCAALGLVVNVFYVFCLIFPPGRNMNVKQPLLTLLVLMIVCTSLFQVILILHYILKVTSSIYRLKQAVEVFILYTVRVSIPTTVWLNIFYCSQIVPVQNVLLVWAKKHIKELMCLFFVISSIYFLLYFALEFWMEYNSNSSTSELLLNTTEHNVTDFLDVRLQIDQICDTLDTVTMILVLLGLVIMLSATGSTAQYLYKHIKNMTKSGTPFNSQPLINQVRVTVTGLVQGLLFLLCSTGMFLEVYCNYHKLLIDQNVLWTLFSFYSLATTINLGVGQSLFRQRVVQLCQKA